jgi:hypothetical protein
MNNPSLLDPYIEIFKTHFVKPLADEKNTKKRLEIFNRDRLAW